jgi:hypothetical protein
MKKINLKIIFGVVRDPYDRIFSCYNYLVKKNWYIDKYPKTYLKLKKPNNFLEFVNNLYELFENNKLVHNNFKNIINKVKIKKSYDIPSLYPNIIHKIQKI